MEQNFNVTTYIQDKTNEYYVTAAVFPGLCESRLTAASFVLNWIKIQSFQRRARGGKTDFEVTVGWNSEVWASISEHMTSFKLWHQHKCVLVTIMTLTWMVGTQDLVNEDGQCLG